TTRQKTSESMIIPCASTYGSQSTSRCRIQMSCKCETPQTPQAFNQTDQTGQQGAADPADQIRRAAAGLPAGAALLRGLQDKGFDPGSPSCRPPGAEADLL